MDVRSSPQIYGLVLHRSVARFRPTHSVLLLEGGCSSYLNRSIHCTVREEGCGLLIL